LGLISDRMHVGIRVTALYICIPLSLSIYYSLSLSQRYTHRGTQAHSISQHRKSQTGGWPTASKFSHSKGRGPRSTHLCHSLFGLANLVTPGSFPLQS